MTMPEKRSGSNPGLRETLETAATICWWGFGLWGFLLNISVIYQGEGIWGVLLGILLFPALFFLAPIYAIVVFGNWFPALVCYGGIVISLAIVGWAASLHDEESE